MSPEPLVLLPGMMCDARLFAPQIAALSCVRSVMVANLARAERIEDMARQVLEEAPPRFALAGLSMGGIVAMEVIRRAPERVTRLALMDTNPLAETPAIAAAREPQIVAARSGRMLEVLRDEMMPLYAAPGVGQAAMQPLVLDMAQALGPEVFVAQSRALQRRPDQQRSLREIAVPVLVLCGRHDALCPLRRHELMRDLIPRAVMEVIEDAGHLPVLEQPEATTAALHRWLSDTLLLV